MAARQGKGRRGGRPGPASENNSRRQSSTSTDLLRALRWRVWPPDEAQALARRRTYAELRRRHLDAAVAAWRRDRTASRWHVDRMAELHRREVRHG